MNIELTRFRVKKGKSVQFLNDNMGDVLVL